MRCFHTGIDRLHVAVTSRLAPPVFRHGLDSPSLQQHLEAVQLALPALTKARYYTLTTHTLAGQLAAVFSYAAAHNPICPSSFITTALPRCPTTKVFGAFFAPVC